MNSENIFFAIKEGIIIYSLILASSLFVKKRPLQQMTFLDLIIILIISESMVLGILSFHQSPRSIFIMAFVLSILKIITNDLTYRFRWFKEFVSGQPQVIILNGKIHKRMLKKLKISEDEVFETLRSHAIMKSEDVKCAIFEPDGKISIIKYH